MLSVRSRRLVSLDKYDQPTSQNVRVLVSGNGRMGALVAQAVEQSEGFELAGQVGIEHVAVLDGTEGTLDGVDLVIDFTNKDMLPHLARYLRRHPAALVCGTTGFDEDDFADLDELAEQMPVLWSSNYSVGVALLKRLAREASGVLGAWDIEIVETHHNKKADAPSGTALSLLEAVDEQGSCEHIFGREGMLGERPQKQIAVHALRGGTVAGTHTVHFFGPDEEVALTHRATSRQIFVSGALAAALKLVGKPAGRYSFDELMFG